MKVLPLYLPHQGCSHQCVYCNQPLVVGAREDRPRWEDRLRAFSPAPSEDWEIAFFGGTFSALSRETMGLCFQQAAPFLLQHRVRGFRISTRPDQVSDETLDFLREAGVSTIELGVESLDDEVLRHSGRGHSAETAVDACRRIKQKGFALGIHLMCGLPAQTRESFYTTVDRSVELRMDLVRVAPALVLKDTPLEKLYHRGRYQPLPLADAIYQCAYAYRVFHHRQIAIARMGLGLSDENGDGTDKVVAGPWHPAFRHEVESYLACETITGILSREPEAVCITVNPRDLSIVVGDKRRNLRAWHSSGCPGLEIWRDENQPRYTVGSGSGKCYSLFLGDEMEMDPLS